MKKWVASAIAITMSFHGSLPADSYPEAVIENPEMTEDTAPQPQNNETLPEAEQQEQLQPEQKKPTFSTVHPPAEVPALAPPEKEEDPVVEVSKANDDEEIKANKNRWQKIAIAAGAVIIATVALILVGTHQGK